MRLLTSVLVMGSVLLGAAALQAAADSQAVSFAESVRPTINHAAIEKLGWKLSCQAYTFREMSLLETIDVLHALGMRYIELFPGQRLSPENNAGFDHNASPEMISQVKAALRKAGIKPVCYGVVGLDNNEAEARKVFDFAKTMGLINIVSEPSEDSFAMLDKLCKEYKINIAIHNHPKPSHYWDPDTVLRVTKGLSKRIGSCADTGHWFRSGLDALDCIKKLKGRIVSSHFKDLNEQKEDMPWGTGVQNAAGMLTQLKNQGFKGVFSIEYERTSGNELIENVAKCCAFFSQTAEKLAAK